MNKQGASNFFKHAKEAVSKHSPEILTGIGIAGMVTTTVLAVKATPKALVLIEEKKKEERTDKLTPIDTIKVTWKCYIPAVVTGTASIACLVGASSVNARRNAALATAYQLSTTALSEYKDAVVETIGEKKEKAVKDKVAEKQIEKNPVAKSEVIITNSGDTLCFEPTSGRYFKSDIEKIRRAVNNLNEQMIHDIFGYVSLNDFYDELGLDHTDIGDDLGWNINEGQIKIDFSSQLTNDGTPCVVIDYDVRPTYGYDKIK